MLTNIRIKNFKKLDDVSFELGKSVVLIGPNNSGKTTALQALALWEIGLRKWNEKRKKKSPAKQRIGVTVNRNDLVSIPVPSASLLWRDLHVRSGKNRQNENIRIEITVAGVTKDKAWTCGLEFDYANEESFYCRPLRLNGTDATEAEPPAESLPRMPIPSEAAESRVAFLPPMSGLADREFLKQSGEIGFLIGQGQTAQVLRNLCFQVFQTNQEKWTRLTEQINSLFGVTLSEPLFIKERSEIVMTYRNRNNIELDLSSSGRGLQQTLLLLAHLYANPSTVLLLDEPDAHLEILRQRQIYKIITTIAEEQGSQIVAASHSEVVLNEAADRDMVVAFIGKPHRIDSNNNQVMKSLKSIGYDQYYMAEETGWVLYLEGSTDFEILKTFASRLGHRAQEFLERPFVHYLATNAPKVARDHFYGLREAKPDLVGIAIYDRLDKTLDRNNPALVELMWTRREIENYFCIEAVLLDYAKQGHDKKSAPPSDQSKVAPEDLFLAAREQAMRESINEVSAALKTLGKPEPWSSDIKATDEFLDPMFDRYFQKLTLPNLMRKTTYYELAKHLPVDQISPEITEKLDAIVLLATKAKPRL